MAIIGNQINSTNYLSDQFSGDGSTVAFPLSLAPASAASISVYVSGLYQIPGSAYTVSGSTLTFTGAPPTGTNNIYVLYLGVKNQNLVPVNGSITPQMLNNANVVYWGTGNNNVGIGTTAPAYGLHINGTSTSAYIRITNSTGPYNGKFTVEDTGETSIGSWSATNLWLLANNSTKMTVSANGNVGIGTTTPANKFEIVSGDGTGAMLAVIKGGSTGGDYSILAMNNGSTTRGRLVADAGVDGFRLDTSGGANTILTFHTGSGYSERARINANGTFQVSGYGNNIPQIRLSTGDNVTTDGVYAAEGGQVRFYQRQNASTYQRHLDIVSNGDSSWGGVIKLYTNPDGSATTVERVRVAANGNVGVGVTSPAHTLDVSSGGSKFNYLQITNNGYSGTGATTPELYSPAAATLAIAAGGAERARINSSGYLQMGTNPFAFAGPSGTGNAIMPWFKSISVADNSTTLLCTIDGSSTYTFKFSGMFLVSFHDGSSPWGTKTWLYTLAGRVAQFSGTFSPASALVSSSGDLDNATGTLQPVISVTSSHTAGQMNGKMYINIQTGSGHAGYATVMLWGSGDYASVY